MRWLLLTSVACAAGLAAMPASAAKPADPCMLITTVDASTALGANPRAAKAKTVGTTRTCTYTIKKKTVTVTTSKVAKKGTFDKSAKATKGVVVPMLGVGADAWSANGTTILVWKNGTAVTIAFTGLQPFVSVQQSLAKTAVGRL
jgi:hypothetical protein